MTRHLRPLLALLALSSAAPSLAQPDDLERSVALMAKIASATSPSFSPDGKRIAYVSNLNGIPQVWIVDAAGGYPQLVTAFDDPVGFVEWSPDGAWLAFTLAPGGGHERAGLSRPPRRLGREAPDERRQGDQPPRALVRRRLPPRPRLEPAQRRCDRLLRLRRRRRSAAPRHAEPRHRRVRGPDARQEARAPGSPRQPRRQQPLRGRARDRQGDPADSARRSRLLQRRLREGRPRGLSRDERRRQSRPDRLRAHGALSERCSREGHDSRRAARTRSSRPSSSTTPGRRRRSSGTCPARATSSCWI